MKLSKRAIDAIQLQSRSNGKYYFCQEVDELLDEIAAAAEAQRAELRRLKMVEQEYGECLVQSDELEAALAEKDEEIERAKAENEASLQKTVEMLNSAKEELTRLRAVEAEYLDQQAAIEAASAEATALQQKMEAAEAERLEREKQANEALEAQKAALEQELEAAKADYLVKAQQADAAIAENRAEFLRLQKVEADYLGQKDDIAGILLTAQSISNEIVEKERKRVKAELASAEERKRQLDAEIATLTQQKSELDAEMEKTVAHYTKRRKKLCAELKHDVAALLGEIDLKNEDDEDEDDSEETPPTARNTLISFPSVAGGQNASNA